MIGQALAWWHRGSWWQWGGDRQRQAASVVGRSPRRCQSTWYRHTIQMTRSDNASGQIYVLLILVRITDSENLNAKTPSPTTPATVPATAESLYHTTYFELKGRRIPRLSNRDIGKICVELRVVGAACSLLHPYYLGLFSTLDRDP